MWTASRSAADDYLIETGEEIYASNSEEGEEAYKRYIDSGNTEDVEYHEAWYRWQYDRPLDGEDLKKLLVLNYPPFLRYYHIFFLCKNMHWEGYRPKYNCCRHSSSRQSVPRQVPA